MPPIDLLLQMSCATDVEDFLQFIDKSSIDAKDNLGTCRVGDMLMRLECGGTVQSSAILCCNSVTERYLL